MGEPRPRSAAPRSSTSTPASPARAPSPPYVPLRAGTDIAFLGAIVRHILSRSRPLRSTSSSTPTRDDRRRGLPRHRGSRRALLRLGPRDAHLRPRVLAVRGHGRGSRLGPREIDAPRRATYGGTRGRARGVASRSTTIATLQHPRCVYQMLRAGTSPATPPNSSSGSAASARTFARCARRFVRQLRPRAHERPWCTPWVDPAHGGGRSTSAPPRSSSCCWATSGVRAAASWRCVDTRRSRARPTSRRSTTPAGIPAHAARARRTGRSTRTSTPMVRRRRLLGQHGRLHRHLLKARWGDAATADNDFRFDYLPRLTGDHQPYDTSWWGRSTGRSRGASCIGENPTVGANTWIQPRRDTNLDWLVVRDLVDDQDARRLEGRPEIETGRAATPGQIATEVFFLPRRATPRRKGPSPTPSGWCSGTSKAVEPRGDRRSRALVHLPPRASGARAARRGRAPSATAPARSDLGLPDRGRPRRARRRGRPA